MYIYLASSWRNPYQSLVLNELLVNSFDVYDFKNPKDGEHGFSWKEIDSGYESWSTKEYINILNNPIAISGYDFDWRAMNQATHCVLLLPCGRSAHLEAGYFVGAGKPLYILILEAKTEPELMYKMAHGVFTTISGLVKQLHAQ